jgi:hypothetical protein
MAEAFIYAVGMSGRMTGFVHKVENAFTAYTDKVDRRKITIDHCQSATVISEPLKTVHEAFQFIMDNSAIY